MSRFILSAFADEIDPNLQTQMNELERYNIKHIEIRGVNGRNITQHTLDEVREIKKQLDDRGFRISAVGSPIGKISITDDFAPHLDLFRHTLEIAKILETRYIRMFSFYIPEGQNPEMYRDQVMERLAEFIKAAEGLDVVLLHENEKNVYGDTAERCLDILKTMNSPILKATFDPANFVQCNVEPYPHAYELLKDYIEYVHIKDAVFGQPNPVPAGMGDARIAEFLTALYNRGFEGFLSLEPHLGAFQGLAELEKDPTLKEMPEGGPRLFAVAENALRKIISEIE